MNIEALKKRFNVKGVSFSAGSGNFPCIEIRTPLAKAKICTHGAHILEFTPAGEAPVLWMSGHSWYETGKPIRGGVPVCWPWFGGAIQPAHGFARISDWEVAGISPLADGRMTVKLTLSEKQVFDPALIRFPFELALTFTIGKTLTMALEMKNNGDVPAHVSAALHTYFAVADAARISISGLDGITYEDRVVGSTHPTGNVQHGDVVIAAELDNLYMDTESAVEITDPVMKRKIRVEKTGSRSTVVWNPWVRKSAAMPDFGDEEYHTMVCVEAVNAGADARTLAPGETHTLTQHIAVVK